MKILIIGNYPPLVGGEERQIYETVRYLKKRHKIIILTPLAKRKKTKNPKIICVPSLSNNIVIRNFIFSLFAIPYLISILRKEKPDIMHIHFGFTNQFYFIFSRLFSIPLIFTLHGCYGSKYFDFKLLRKITKFSLSKAKKIIAVSRRTYLGLKEMKLEDKSIIIPNGVDINFFKPSKNVKNNTIAFFGRLHPQKGVEYLLEAFKKVQKKNKKVKLMIVGTGPLEKKLKNIAKKENLNCKFFGHVSDKKLVQIVSSSYMVVFPSLWEGMPLAILEALAMGRPVIASKVSGIEDVIKNGKNGILIEPKKPSQLANKILFLLENKKIAERLGNEGRKVAINYSWKEIVKNIENVYTTVKK
jgi:glycosyltransferase involved in cell wall biosynthesis